MSDRKRPADDESNNDRKLQRYNDDYVVKMMCPGRCAGAIIGNGGEKIALIKEKSGARVKVTRARENFPGMDERVVTVSGSEQQIQDCIIMCQGYIRNDQPPEHVKVSKKEAERKQILKILVAGTSAGRIIGKSGSKIKELRANHDVNIDVTKPDKLPFRLNENPVSISGKDEDTINNCLRDIVSLIMEDPRSSMKWNVNYDEYRDVPSTAESFGRRDGYDGRDSYRGDYYNRDSGYGGYSGGGGYGSGYNDYRDGYGSRDGGRDPYESGRGYDGPRGYGGDRGYDRYEGRGYDDGYRKGYSGGGSDAYRSSAYGGYNDRRY